METARTTLFRHQGTAALSWAMSVAIAFGGVSMIAGKSLASLLGWWETAEGSHSWIIPFITALVLWWRRDRILAAGTAPTWWGFAVMAVGVILLLVDEVGQLQRVALPAVLMIAFGGIVAGLGWPAARYATAPLALLLFAMRPPDSLYVELSLTLQLISSMLGTAMLRLLGISVFLDGNVIDLGVYKLQVLEACNGLRYLFPLSCFGFLCAWIYRAPFWAKAIVLFSVIPITIFTNSARIAITGVLVKFTAVEYAEGFMHAFEGWVVFLAALALLFGLMWLVSQLRGQRGGIRELLDFDRLKGAHIPLPKPPVLPDKARRWWGLPAPWLAGVVLLLLAWPAYAALKNRDQLIPVRPALVTFPTRVGDWRGQPRSVDAETQKVLGSSKYFLGDYVRTSIPGVVNLWIAYYDQQVRVAAFHTPQQCLPGAGWEFVSLKRVISPVSGTDGEEFHLNRAIVQRGQDKILVYFWLEARGEQFADPQRFKFANVRDSLLHRRSDGALVRLTTPILPLETEAGAEARLVDFMQAAYPWLDPYVGR